MVIYITTKLRFIIYIFIYDIRKFNHQNIVRCHGISIESTLNQDENLVIFMEVCDWSLADVFLCDKHPMEMCQCNSHRKSSCHSFTKKARNSKEYMDAFKLFTKTLKEILNGLIYLHEKGCAHRGLKLSNVLVCIYFSSTVKTHISN